VSEVMSRIHTYREATTVCCSRHFRRLCKIPKSDC